MTNHDLNASPLRPRVSPVTWALWAAALASVASLLMPAWVADHPPAVPPSVARQAGAGNEPLADEEADQLLYATTGVDPRAAMPPRAATKPDHLSGGEVVALRP